MLFFVSPHQFEKLCLPEDSPLRHVLKNLNPLSEEQSVMRTMLVGGLLDVLVYNQNRNEHNLKLFEIGSVFLYRQKSL